MEPETTGGDSRRTSRKRSQRDLSSPSSTHALKTSSARARARRSATTTANACCCRPPLLRLPPELLELIALHLATRSPNLGPPAALLPLLSTCRGIYERLGWGVNGGKDNWAFWARIAGAKFTSCAETDAPYIPYEGYPYAPLDPSHFSLESDRAHADQSRANTKGGNTLAYRAFTLRTRSLALSLIRQGDPHAPGAGRALRVAWGMLLEDGGEGERLDFSKVDVALGRSTSGMGMSTHLILLRSSSSVYLAC
ncbi:hypothetical protein B0H13DRAFT_2047846 [Mycena leptocephala]|nr:hypothetical protein B0H13DRAFT_2047846 [Mycena leptocephala]